LSLDNGVKSWTYDPAGRRTEATLGNDVTSVFTYDLNNRITRIQHADEWSNDLFDVSHGYDPVGNRLWTQDNLRPGRDEPFEYDNLNRPPPRHAGLR
jgi:YD repeat-containing protein